MQREAGSSSSNRRGKGKRTMITLFHCVIVYDRWWRAMDAFRNETGQDLIEYGLLAGLIAAVAIGVVLLTGVEVGAWWSFIGEVVDSWW